MKFAKRFMLLMVSLSTMTGCWDAQDIERMYYVNSMVIDYIDGKYELYAQVVNFQAMASGAESGPTSGGVQAYIGIGKGATFGKAVHNLYGHTQRRLYWGHTAAIVLTENVLKQGAENVIDILRFHEIRHTAWFFGTRATPKEILSSMPIVELSVIQSFLGEPEEGHEQSSFIEPIRMHRFFSYVYEPGMTVIFPILNTVDYWFQENKPFPSLVMEGAGFIKNYHFQGTLLHGDIYGLRWLSDGTHRSPLLLRKGEEVIGTVVLETPKSKITPVVKNNNVTFNVECKLNATVLEINEELSNSEIKDMINKEVEKQIRHTFTKGLEKNIDSLNLSHIFYQKNLKVWKEMADAQGEIRLKSDSLSDVSVEVTLLKTETDKLQPVDEPEAKKKKLFW